MANPTWTTAVVIDEAATEAPYGTMTGARGPVLAIATLCILQGLDGLIGQSVILCYQGPWAALAGGAGPSLR